MYSKIESQDLLNSLKLLCNEDKFKTYFTKYLQLKEIDSVTTQELINNLAELLLIPEYTSAIVKYYSKYLLQFLSFAIPLDSLESSVYSYETHVKNCVVLSLISKNHPDANRFMLQYFEKYPSPFDKEYFESKQTPIPTKKRKITTELLKCKTNALELVECCYSFLKTNADFFRTKWNWSEFIQTFYNHNDDMVKWISCNCIAIITGMHEHQLNALLGKKLSNDKIIECSLKHYNDYEINKTIDVHISTSKSAENIEITEPNIFDNVVSVVGILLPIHQKSQNVKHLVQVKSAQSNLRKVALGIAANRAICLQGPVGSSKTALVEYLAALTGRTLGESFIKVQLGDQTDSKMLLGTYRCTDIPGEFVWQPGVLTQAVTDGSWLLLEDIDSASMDIATVITSLLENNNLSVPGFRDTVPITPGFQLFVTQRLMSSITGYHKKHSNANSILEKHLLQVNIEPLTQMELIEIVKIQFPQLTTVATRIVDVFMLFSMGHNENLSRSGRLTSTRDLFKWCERAIIDFDISSQNSALKVFQDAIDIFCCSLPSIDERLRLAKAISTRLGIVETKAEYFCNSYKPNLSLTATNLAAGRTLIQRQSDALYSKKSKFSFTRPSSCLLERIICCVNLKEPVLLVGETGTGKTSSVQYLAQTIGQKLIVINMNQQSDSADLLGGYKPVDLKYVIAPIRVEFEKLFRGYFSMEHNQKFVQHIANCFNSNKWATLLILMKHSQAAAVKRLKAPQAGEKRTAAPITDSATYLKQWTDIGNKLSKLSIQLKQQSALAFAFIEGSLVKAIEKGHWVLLDEINLANAETLECLSGLLEGSRGSLSLLERGDRKPVTRHEQFTLFACMNPSTDVGKKDLPAGLRNRFSEFFVEELTEKNDLILLVNSYLKDISVPQPKVEKIVKFYLNIRKEATLNLSDGLGHKPHYSLRTLCRALTISSKNYCGSVDRNLYEAFCLSFLTQLDTNSYKIVEKMISKSIIGNAKDVNSVLKQPILEPTSDTPNSFVQFEGYWVSRGDLEPEVPKGYVLTESVRRNLKDLVRVVAIGHLPVLLQGDTSVGKTSLITYLAKSSGNRCVRINNHEHTDLQEYIGSYVADTDGKLVFREGVLVEAMRKGHWIILDELNLAPTDVLEALNRVLDDNRELFIPETQETVKAHSAFMLFATQNPPGAYGGRKMLSRAFRNRFVELHFNEIPPAELETIMHERCEIPPSYCKKMIACMTDLQMRRRGSAAFAGKQGFITLRDLFRWGERYRLAPQTDKLYDWDQHIADEGYLVLAGRVRKVDERNEITEVLKKHIKRSVIPDNLFSLHENTSTVTRKILEKIYDKRHLYKNIVWTFNTRQLAVLVGKALEFTEPVLLVGETGGGKTTVCRLIAENNGQKLITVNCHMHTESSDFIGGLRPVREHTEENKNKLFEWVDGPLLQAMQLGDVFLADEISLADDSVLERLNSLLEPERSLLLAEKGTDLTSPTDSVSITANERFHFIGTMNPGGDFGKKELSPALRNRFTEIWCETCTDRNDLIDIIEHNLKNGLSFGNQEDGSSGIGRSVMDFIEWFRNTEIGKRFTISIRDILTWVNFINVSSESIEISEAYIHGACLTFLDSFGSGVTGMESAQSLNKLRDDCTDFLTKQITSNGLIATLITENINVEIHDTKFGIKPFYIQKGNYTKPRDSFNFTAPTTLFNALRLLRGLQLNKAILLEGSPGVGKTSLVSALAKTTQHKLLRINLSDQTDICDLFGADLPVEGGQGGEFAWRDGPFLQALKNGDWIVLDELNLASQSVLEGLNACLDHRGEIFIPELGKTFYVKPGTRLFACQNPLRQGGSRRGLPKSFLNRFTQVYIDALSKTDLLLILSSQFPQIPTDIRDKMVEFNHQLVHETDTHKFGHKGSPWEFNLRDLTRWCQTMLHQTVADTDDSAVLYKPEASMFLIYGDRMRTDLDKSRVRDIFVSVFGSCGLYGQCPVPYITRDYVYVGDVKMKRGLEESVNLNVLKQDKTCFVLRKQVEVLRSLMYCVNLNWMSILVGSSASGKSSVVRTLAQLTGAELRTLAVNSAMDTTDILGGFEQADYNRHLEEISSKVERILLAVVQTYLLNSSDIHLSTKLMKKWEEYRTILHTETEQRTMADETKLFTVKLQQLNEILVSLKSHKNAENFTDNLTNLCERLEKLRLNVEKEGTLNAGGKFEWVDSILIKCLQDGCWLLIENVNLCSPAVLDRLNALLEPNGVLTIGERGVDDNGEMINIVPHPNFRLFLTIDPKNGEISRAMRNRGVEIYILNETETGNRNVYDTKALIGQNGVQGERFQEILIEIHDFICDLVLGEKPTISHILQSSFLISQQLIRGINIIDSYSSAIIDVYVKTKSIHDFNIPDPITAIEIQVKTVLQDYLSQTQIEIYSLDHKTVKSIDLQNDSNLEQIKQQSVLIQQLLSKEISTKHANYVLLSFSITSYDNLALRHSYMLDQLKNVDDKYIGIIQTMFTTLKEFFMTKVGFKNQTLPLDSHWLPNTIDTYTTAAESNQIFVLLYFIIHKMANDLVIVQPGKKYTKLNVLQYSKAVFDKKLSQASIQQPLIINFYNLIITFDTFLTSLLTRLSLKLDSNDTVLALTVLNWRFVMQDIGNLVIYDKNDKNLNLNQVLSQIIVRYKWFLKHTIGFFMCCTDKETVVELMRIITLINASLENNFSNFAKIAKRFTKSSNRPLPLTNEEQIDMISNLHQAADITNLTLTNNIYFQQKCELNLINVQLRQLIFDAKKEIRHSTENAVDNLKLIQDNLTISETNFKDTELQVLPVTDYFGVCLVNSLRKHIFDPTNMAEKKCQTLRKIITVPVDLCEIIESYFETKDEQLVHELTFSLTSYFKNAISLSPSRYLKWLLKDGITFHEQDLSTHVPALTYAVTNICVSDLSSKDLVATATLGKNKEKTEQLRYLNELIWQNLPSFTSNNIIKNDAEYIVQSYNNFITLLEKALTGQNMSTTVEKKATICITKINEIYIQNPESSELTTNKSKILNIFQQLCTKIENIKSSVDLDLILETGNVYCLLNYIKILLNTQLQVIDPLDKVVLKKKYCGEERIVCSDLKDALILQNEIYTGSAKTLHPFCAILAVKIQNYKRKEEELSKFVAVRPKNIPYQTLLKEVSHNLNTLLSEEFFVTMHEKINTCIHNLKQAIATKSTINLEGSNDVLSQSNSWLHSQENSFKKLVKYRVGYPDIIEPILSNITELSYGVKLLNTLLKKLLIQYEYKQHNLNTFMRNMVQFPVLSDTQKSVINLIELCTHSKNIGLISKIIKCDDIPNIIKQENLRMLLCGIQEIYNLFVVTSPSYLEPQNKMLLYLEGLISLFVSAWYTQEADRQKKLEDEQSLYKTKTKCENLTEEQEIYKDMKILFPNFHEQDFPDFQQQQLGDTPDDALTDESELSGVITTDDVLFVANIHSELMQLYTKSEWLNPKKKNLDPNYITPFLQRFKLFNLVQNKIIEGIDSDIDSDIVTSLNLLVSITKSYGEGEELITTANSSPRKSKDQNYDFYKDQKVEETKSCLHILEALNKRIQELLKEWPGHPTLQSISTIIDRVYSFPITSPVSRFLTGFEVLLSKCHEWEENAHSGVSLTEYSQNVTLQIIAWRKLELAGWKDCLNNAFERNKSGVSKWWFYIYSTIQQFTKTENETTTEEVLKIFQEFMEKSSLGEYASRLGLLYAFHCQALHLPKSTKTNIIIPILWNLYNFYAQFSNNVDSKIKSLRSPIEKKLKDFVKIARWNDINYWSIKETVEKTHRTLHKYIKEFEQILKLGVSDCLVNSTSDTSEQVGIWDRPMRHSSEYHYCLEASNYMASVKYKKLLNEPNTSIQENDDTLLSKSEKYFTKSRSLCKNTILNTTYPNLIQNLDSFITEIIETSTHLRNLEVNKELTKPKQKSQAKQILQQKRKALADLFKTLSKCGLSYRTGIIESNLRGKSNKEFLLKPVDLGASFSYIKNKGSCDRLLLNVWDGCETYFLRSIARFAALQAALKQPAPDFGLQNIERCKGFSSHLMILAQDQKSNLIDTTRNLYYLRNYLNQLSEWGDESDIISSDSIKTIIEFLTNLMVIMEQYKIILLSCPGQPNFGSDMVDIPVLDQENEITIKYKYDSNWNNALSDIKLILSIAQKLKTTIEKLETTFPSSDLQIESAKYVFVQDKSSIIAELATLSGKIGNLQQQLGNNSISYSIRWISKEFKHIEDLLKIEYATDTSDVSVDNFKVSVEKLMENILLVIQNVYKKYSSKQDEEPRPDTTEDVEKSELFENNHLKDLVVENLFADISILEIKSVFRKVKKLMEKLYKMNATDAKQCKNLMSHCVPLLEQVVLLYQYFITQQVSAYRVTCKMNAVLLNIFIELASKGFCVPPELSDEKDSDGQTNQQSGGMGLGEGEGEKDVSDKIESEDQLEDAQPAGQEKKNEEKDCKEEDKGIEMSEDFEGKLQDVEKPEDNESQSNSDNDAEKQMGDTEPDADKLDKQIWGSDEEEDENEEEEEESNKQEKEERGEGGELEDQQMAAKEDKGKQNEEDGEDDQQQEKKNEPQPKDINEMDEPEYDEDQTDPYHGKQPPLPEPEPMDLPDDLQLDDGDEKEDQNEENPFDIDSMKEQQLPEEPLEEDKKEESTKVEDKSGDSDTSDEEDATPDEGTADPAEEQQKEENKTENDQENEGLQNTQEEKKEEIDEDKQEKQDSAIDNQQSNEDDIQPMDVDNIESTDNVETNPNQTNAKNADQVSQEQSHDQDGVGQSQMEESETGHRGEVNAAKDSLSAQQDKETPQEKRQRPGESDSKRSLGETTEPVKKKMKTVNLQDNEDNNEDAEDEGAQEGKDADMYQHIKEAKETDTQVMDAATKEQAETQKIKNLDDEKTEEPTDEPTEMDTDDPEPEVAVTQQEKSEKNESKSQKKADGKQQQGDIVEEIKDVEIDGEVVDTTTVSRGNESSYHTQYELLSENQVDRLSTLEIQDLRTELEIQLGTWNEPPPNMEAEQTWEKFSAITSSLARDLSEQLRLVLEPTQASRLRGDFRTGRRINMRKVIPYIASQFRKDKIWLRRTKPSKREYQIVLAIDDSSSMDDNHSKELAFESVALISKALSLLESGQLSVLSFGETTEILHKLTDTFTEKSGVKLLQKFQFTQKKTCVANLVDFVTTMFSDTHTNAPNAKLLVVVSDGRGIFSEGETFVQQAIRRAKFANIFMVFVIIDNPDNKNSILDIRMPVFKEGKLLGIKSYLDSFPFPFYMILRDINSLPSVLSDALRQWFELITNVD